MVNVRYVEESDYDFWFVLDKHIMKEEFLKKVRDKMGYIFLENGNPVGLMRYNMFWDNIPCCTHLIIDNRYRRKGYGREVMAHWEKEMKEKGYGMVMTSTQVDENAQGFYRTLGYQDAGCLIINVPGYEQPMEMFMTKAI